MNKVMKSKAEQIEAQHEDDPGNEENKLGLSFVEKICESHEDEHDHEENEDLKLEGDIIEKYLKELSQSCEDMILSCKFEGHERNCSQIFQPLVTNEGQCCSFNVMPGSIMYKHMEVI